MKKAVSLRPDGKAKTALDLLTDNAFWAVGCFLYAVGINIFNVPNKIAQGGFSGLAIVINYLTGLPVGAVNFALNVPLFILAWIFIGRKFVFKSVWVTGMLSLMIDVMARFSAPYAYKGDKLLAAIFGGLCTGAGVALVLLRGSTTGGTDILSRLLRLLAPHMSYGKMIMLSDLTVVVISAVVFRSFESALYAGIVIFVSSKAIDYLLYGMDSSKMLMVFTEKADEITRELIAHSTRGVSIVPATGGYTGEQKEMLVCVLRSHEVSKTLKIVRSIDPKTFTIITEANEIIGKGFKATFNKD